VVGDVSSAQLIKNGYVSEIESLIPSDDVLDAESDRNRINLTKVHQDSEEIQESILEKLGDFYSHIIGYQELSPPSMKSQIIRGGLLNTLPTSARVSIKLVGIDGFRFGDMFSVRNVLPHPYDENNIFMLTGYKHDINSDGWHTTIDGIMIASTPSGSGLTDQYTEQQLASRGVAGVDSRLTEIYTEVRRIIEAGVRIQDIEAPEKLTFAVLSGLRNPASNEAAGGVPRSAHLYGKAIDIQIISKDTRATYWKQDAIFAKNGSPNPTHIRSQLVHEKVSGIFKQVARSKGIQLRWGGDFTSNYDPNHFDII